MSLKQMLAILRPLRGSVVIEAAVAIAAVLLATSNHGKILPRSEK